MRCTVCQQVVSEVNFFGGTCLSCLRDMQQFEAIEQDKLAGVSRCDECDSYRDELGKCNCPEEN